METMMTKPATTRLMQLLFSLVAAGAISGFAAGLAHAQGTESKEVIDAIVGSEIKEEEARTAVDADKVIAAIQKTPETTETVRKVSNLANVEIVFLTDAVATQGGLPPAIQTTMKQNEAALAELRKELEGNAMLFHAIDSKQILLQDVVAVTFPNPESVIIYAAAAKPAG
jgi:hypothetical protein